MNLLKIFKRPAIEPAPEPRNRRAELRGVYAEALITHTIPNALQQFDDKCPSEIFAGDTARIGFHVTCNIEVPSDDDEPLTFEWTPMED